HRVRDSAGRMPRQHAVGGRGHHRAAADVHRAEHDEHVPLLGAVLMVADEAGAAELGDHRHHGRTIAEQGPDIVGRAAHVDGPAHRGHQLTPGTTDLVASFDNATCITEVTYSYASSQS